MISLKTHNLMENVWQKQPSQVPIDKLKVDNLVEASLHSMAGICMCRANYGHVQYLPPEFHHLGFHLQCKRWNVLNQSTIVKV